MSNNDTDIEEQSLRIKSLRLDIKIKQVQLLEISNQRVAKQRLLETDLKLKDEQLSYQRKINKFYSVLTFSTLSTAIIAAIKSVIK